MALFVYLISYQPKKEEERFIKITNDEVSVLWSRRDGSVGKVINCGLSDQNSGSARSVAESLLEILAPAGKAELVGAWRQCYVESSSLLGNAVKYPIS
jgi:hypothetical protein